MLDPATATLPPPTIATLLIVAEAVAACESVTVVPSVDTAATVVEPGMPVPVIVRPLSAWLNVPAAAPSTVVLVCVVAVRPERADRTALLDFRIVKPPALPTTPL